MAQPLPLFRCNDVCGGASVEVVTAAAAAMVLTPPPPFPLSRDAGALETSVEVSGAFSIASRVTA